jgi:hypothetical protein
VGRVRLLAKNWQGSPSLTLPLRERGPLGLLPLEGGGTCTAEDPRNRKKLSMTHEIFYWPRLDPWQLYRYNAISLKHRNYFETDQTP